MVTISKVYTRTGDAGATRLVDGSEVAKTDPRVEAYGDVDEAGALLVVVRTHPVVEVVEEVLARLQNELFDLGADLATPLGPRDAVGGDTVLRVRAESVTRLEQLCDRFGEGLPVLRSFVLPGGTPAAARLHVVRTVVRRAERRAWAAAQLHGLDLEGGLNPVALRYLNRLSDLCFVLARHLNAGGPEVLWRPGGELD